MNINDNSSPFYQAQLSWLHQAKEIAPEICDWIGLYFKESYFIKAESEHLILGAFIGEPTEHTRIPISRGICGLALRTESVVNVPDDGWLITLSSEVSGYKFYEADGKYNGKAYRLILVIPPDGSYLGVRNAYRRSK